MATQTITQAAFALLCAECSDAIAGGDFATAWSKYAQAQAVHAGLLNSTVSTPNESVSRFSSLDALARAIEKSEAHGAESDRGRFIQTRVGYDS